MAAQTNYKPAQFFVGDNVATLKPLVGRRVKTTAPLTLRINNVAATEKNADDVAELSRGRESFLANVMGDEIFVAFPKDAGAKLPADLEHLVRFVPFHAFKLNRLTFIHNFLMEAK